MIPHIWMEKASGCMCRVKLTEQSCLVDLTFDESVLGEIGKVVGKIVGMTVGNAVQMTVGMAVGMA